MFFMLLMPSLPCRFSHVIYDLQILDSGEQIGLKHFKPVKSLGSGDTGRYITCSYLSRVGNYCVLIEHDFCALLISLL